MQSDFIALYRGQTVSEARIIAITAEPAIVARFLREITGEPADTARPEVQNDAPGKPFEVVKGERE